MSREDNFRHIYEELKVFHRNLGKDNLDRRNNLETSQRYHNKLNRIKDEFKIEICEFQKESESKTDKAEEIDSYISHIKQYISAIKSIVNDRLASCKSNINMTEKFDLKTASAIIPSMNGSESSVKGLIDAIELYDSLLDDAGKKLLTNFVLKTRVSESAKLRLEKTYQSNNALISDMKEMLLTKKSAAALSLQIHNISQKRTSIEQYGKSLEELMVNLTLAQSRGNDHAATVLAAENEKIAINAFANGLHDNELRLIIKAKNFTKLKDAINAAKEEDISKRTDSSQVFQFRDRGNQRKNYSKRGYRGYSNNCNGGNNNYFRGNPSQFRENRNFNYQNRDRGCYRGRNLRRASYRPSQDVGRNERRHFNLQSEVGGNTVGPSTSTFRADETFFRPSM